MTMKSDERVRMSYGEQAFTQDDINHPAHYNMGRIEVIDAIESWQLPYHLGNVVKYVARAAYKGDRLKDLKKAAWYLSREIARAEPAASIAPAGAPFCARCYRVMELLPETYTDGEMSRTLSYQCPKCDSK